VLEAGCARWVGTLALAGPLDGVDGWRGLFVLAVADIEEARRHIVQQQR